MGVSTAKMVLFGISSGRIALDRFGIT